MSALGEIPSWVRVGVKCVYIGCPEYRLPQAKGFAVDALPMIGAIYTIRCVEERPNGLNIRLSELRVSGRWPDGHRFIDAWLHTRAFRPVVEDKSDNEIEAALYHKRGLSQSVTRRKAVDA